MRVKTMKIIPQEEETENQNEKKEVIGMKKIAMLSLLVIGILAITNHAFALVDLSAGKYIYNEKETPGFNYLLERGVK